MAGTGRGERSRRDAASRLAAALRAAPRALREDLWTVSGEPIPRSGRSGWLEWLPAFGMLWVLFAVFLTVAQVNVLAWQYGLRDGTALLVGGVQGVALVGAMFRPVPAWWAATAAMAAAAWALDPRTADDVTYPWTEPGIAVQAGLLALLAFRTRPQAAATALLFSLFAGLACGLLAADVDATGTGRAAVPLIMAGVLGAALRSARLARTQLVVQEEVTAEERARRTLLEERNRIARELHDVVAHHMSVISIQAQVAPHLVESPPQELRENLAGIRANAVEALNELRRVLGVLRSEDVVAEVARHAPQPALDRLGELADNVRAAGPAVSVETTGRRRPLSPGVELSAFRIVQEALSNAIRHAPGAEVRVTIGYETDGLAVRVVNSPPQEPPTPSRGVGHGLLGMRERAAVLGGELVSGPTPDGGYEVLASLPLAGPEGRS